MKQPKSVDELFDELIDAKIVAVRTVQSENEFASNADLVEPANQLLSRFRAEAKQALYDLLESELIGEDVDPDQAKTDRAFNNMVGVNIAKKQQRIILKQLFNIKDTEEK